MQDLMLIRKSSTAITLNQNCMPAMIKCPASLTSICNIPLLMLLTLFPTALSFGSTGGMGWIFSYTENCLDP